MPPKTSLAWIVAGSLVLAVLAERANWGAILWPGLLVAAGVTLLMPGGGPLGHPTAMTVVSIPANAFLYAVVMLSMAKLYRVLRRNL